MISRPAPTPEDDDIQEVVSVKSEPAQSHQEYQDPSKRHNILTVDKKNKTRLNECFSSTNWSIFNKESQLMKNAYKKFGCVV